MRLLGFHFLPEFFDHLLCFRRNLFDASLASVLLQNHFARRIDPNLVQRFDGALRHQVKTAKRLYLVPEQLDSVRILFGQVKDIQNIATDRKLSRRFHLIDLLVSHLRELPCGLRKL